MWLDAIFGICSFLFLFLLLLSSLLLKVTQSLVESAVRASVVDVSVWKGCGAGCWKHQGQVKQLETVLKNTIELMMGRLNLSAMTPPLRLYLKEIKGEKVSFKVYMCWTLFPLEAKVRNRNCLGQYSSALSYFTFRVSWVISASHSEERENYPSF